MKYDKELLAYLLQKYCHDHDEDRCKTKVGMVKRLVHNHIDEFLSSEGMSLRDIEHFMSFEDRLLHLDELKKLGGYEFYSDWFNFLDDDFLANHAKEALAATQRLSIQRRIATLMSTQEILENVPLFNESIFTGLIGVLKMKKASYNDYVELLIKFYENHWRGSRRSFLEKIRWGVEDVAEYTQLNVKTLTEDILCHYMDDIKVIGDVINHHDDWEKLGVDYKEYVDQYIELLQKEYRVNRAFVKDFIDRFGYYYFGDDESTDKAISSGEINTILSKIPLYELKRYLDEMDSVCLSFFFRNIEEAGGDIGIIEKRLHKCKSFMHLRSKADIEIAWVLLEFGRKIFDDKTFYKANIQRCRYFREWRWKYLHSK